MMMPEQFIARAMGVEWRRWRADWLAMDCFGLVVMWHRHVLGVELGDVPRTDIARGFAALDGWVQCDPASGSTGFMTWRDGAPTHCGMLAKPGFVLHSQEGRPLPEHGSVRLTRLAVMQRLCPDLRFYRFAPPPC